MTLHEHFVQMARNNAWSNLRLYGACKLLDAEAINAKRVSFFPGLLITLQHLWIVDEFYVDGLEEAGQGRNVFADEQKHTTIDALLTAQKAVDQRLISLCKSKFTEQNLDKTIALDREDGPHEDKAQDILAHLFVHQIHHRGQVHAMLAGTDVKPPQLDEFFLASDRLIADRELSQDRRDRAQTLKGSTLLSLIRQKP